MSIEKIKNNFIEAKTLLNNFINDTETWFLIEKAGNILVSALKSGNKILSCGNGGSMCDAMHFAEELSGKFRDSRKSLPAISISDVGHITCTANDFGFNEVFSRYIEGLGNKNDVLVAISTSGNSENILKAAEAAKNKEMKIIGLTGKDGGKLASLCDVEIRVKHLGYADRIQEIHIKVIHSLIHFIEIEMFNV